MKYGYARVWTDGQSVAAQVVAMNAAPTRDDQLVGAPAIELSETYDL
jgi:hypothetical protein